MSRCLSVIAFLGLVGIFGCSSFQNKDVVNNSNLDPITRKPTSSFTLTPGVTEAAVNVNGLTINYLKAGRARGPLLVFLHGFPEFSLSWERYLLNEDLRRRFTMVAIDIRGFGKSTAPPNVEDYSAENIASDVVSVVRSLGYAKFNLVGHDWGGILAYQTAALYPRAVKKLLIMNSPHPKVLCALHATPRFQQYAMTHYVRGIRRETNADSATFSNFGAQSYTAQNGRLLQSVTFQLINTGFFDERMRLAYMTQWLGDPTSSDPSRIERQLSLYRAAQFFKTDPSLCSSVDPTVVRARTTIIWGTQDRWLSQENLDTISNYVNVARIIRDENADHWSNHKSFNRAIEVLRRF